MTPRALFVFPGRGSYGASELGTLRRIAQTSARAAAIVEEVAEAMDAPRRAYGRDSILTLDAARAFEPGVHWVGENASALTVACGLVDARLIEQAGTVDVAGVLGNSLGFYTALGASGVLTLADLGTFIEKIVTLQAERGRGGQLMVPLCDDGWRPDPAKRAAVERALSESGAYLSVDLGAYAVLAGEEASLSSLEAILPKSQQGSRTWPMRVPKHHAFHTPLLEGVSEGARPLATTLDWRAPRTHLVLGNGAIATPWSADPAALAAYTTAEQIVTTYRFRDALRTGLRELAPDIVILAGPGESIGGSIGAAIAAEGWKRVTSRAEFMTRQSTAAPVLLSLARPEQRARVIMG